MPEFMKLPKVLGNAPTGRRPGTPVTSQGYAGDANSRALSARGRSQASLPGVQQRNAQLRGQEQSRYRDQAARSPINTPEQGKRYMQPPAAPTFNHNLSGVQQSVSKAVGLKRLANKVARTFGKR